MRSYGEKDYRGFVRRARELSEHYAGRATKYQHYLDQLTDKLPRQIARAQRDAAKPAAIQAAHDIRELLGSEGQLYRCVGMWWVMGPEQVWRKRDWHDRLPWLFHHRNLNVLMGAVVAMAQGDPTLCKADIIARYRYYAPCPTCVEVKPLIVTPEVRVVTVAPETFTGGPNT